jgi:hypothetical protein
MQKLLRSEWLDPNKKFPFPDWIKISGWIAETIPPAKHAETWNEFAREWMRGIGDRFSAPMNLSESTHFILNAPQTYLYASTCLVQLEDYRTRIVQLLGELGESTWLSKSAVIIAPGQMDFVSYLFDYHDDGETSLPGGVYLNRGFGHFVLPDGNLTQHSSALAHELCHAVIGPRDMPLWLNEAITQHVEHHLTRRHPYQLDQSVVQEHRNYWTPERLPSFWSGHSFSFADEGGRLSYHLARFLFNALSRHGAVLTLQFMLAAKSEDAGFGAARTVLDVDLGDLIADFLGKSSWVPSRHIAL